MNNKYAAGTARTAAYMRMHCPPERYDAPSDRAHSCTKTDILRLGENTALVDVTNIGS